MFYNTADESIQIQKPNDICFIIKYLKVSAFFFKCSCKYFITVSTSQPLEILIRSFH